MSKYEMRLAQARHHMIDSMIGLHNRIGVLNSKLICRVPLQDDEDDALQISLTYIGEATTRINHAIEELEG
jgi:hypothetical protein